MVRIPIKSLKNIPLGPDGIPIGYREVHLRHKVGGEVVGELSFFEKIEESETKTHEEKEL